VGFILALGQTRGLALVLIVLGGVAFALSGMSLLTPRTVSIWCDFGYAPTRYVPVEDRTTGCTSFRSHLEANSGPNRNDTSWISGGWGLGPEPTPLAVGENWDALVVPESDGRELFPVEVVVGCVGLVLGMGMCRRRTGDE
jgi:hypothetical protein